MIQFTELPSDRLTRRIYYYIGFMTLDKYNIGPMYIIVRRIRTKRGKKSTMDVHGAFVRVTGEEGTKILIPKCDFIIEGIDKDIEINPKCKFMLGTNYGSNMVLSNPRLLGRTDFIVCDFEIKGGN